MGLQSHILIAKPGTTFSNLGNRLPKFSADARHSIELDAATKETDDRFNYLESTISSSDQRDEIQNRIDTARRAFLQLETVI